MNTSGNILLVFFLFFALLANGQDAYWQQRTNYKISVQLNTDFHTLDGFEKITYINHSPDTLTYIWFHLWPNAFKNDRTAFSDQLIENGRTDFYFSESNERGYINRLDFRINDVRADVEDHPEHIDIVKLILPKILYPNDSIIITTPFHVQLPKNFSRGGHIGKTYQLTQWYPKPAVYDRKGWHPMPYLDQGEFYGEYGDYEVEISLPKSYHVLSTGSLAAPDDASVTNTDSIKTLVFKQQKVHDFAWFASKTLQIKRDSIQLPTGRVLQLQAAHLPEHKKLWESSIAYMKQAVLERTGLIGAYEYDILSIVEVNMKNNGGMEYPCIATIHNVGDEKELETIIKHEIGHNWFQGMIGNNERAHAWMDEGINTYYDRRLDAAKNKNPVWKFFVNYEAALARTYQRIGKDQAVSVASDKFSSINYYLSAYHKAADILELIEQKMGRAAFDEAMRNYFNEWKFSHPYPTDFFAKLQQFSSWRLDSLFQLFDKKGELPVAKSKYKLNLSLLPGLSLMKENRIAVTPLVGYNITDGFMAGAAISNYTLPPSKFQWLLAPLYGTQSKAFNYAGRMSYTWYPSALFERIVFSVSGMKFNTRDFTDTAGNKYITGFRRFVPSVKWVFKSDNPRSTREKYVQWKTFIIDEDRLRFTSDTFTNGNRFLKIKKETSDRLLH
ncbi:MAG: M1 family metallopeptidase, partial [Bacteroidota bacterium]